MFLAAGVLSLIFVSNSDAAEGPRFGERGQIVLATFVGANLGWSRDASGTTERSRTLQLWPGLEYFIAHAVSIGAQARYERTDVTGSAPSSSSRAAVVGVGYNFNLGERVSFWPRVYLGYGHQTWGSASWSSTGIGIPAPFLFHPVSHFYVGGGPTFARDLWVTGSHPTTTGVGIQSTIGGWF